MSDDPRVVTRPSGREYLRFGNAPGGNYEMAVDMLGEQLQVATEESGVPTATLLQVAHDKWCAMLAGKGPRNCDPEVTVQETRIAR